LLVVLAAVASACASVRTPLRQDIAVIEAGSATIARIDGHQIHSGNDGAFEVRPGGHTVEISAAWIRYENNLLPDQIPLFASLCLKAKPGRRYRIKTAVIGGRKRVFFIDTATGEPPKTPCGPDEDDD
jgi:hypothetical protein